MTNCMLTVMNMSVGEVTAIIATTAVIIGGISFAGVWLFKQFKKLKSIQDKFSKIDDHEKALAGIQVTLDKIYETVESQRQVNYKHIRTKLVDICSDAIAHGEISAAKYKALCELYEEYTIRFADMKPNGYVKKLMARVDDPSQVRIIGELDD